MDVENFLSSKDEQCASMHSMAKYHLIFNLKSKCFFPPSHPFPLLSLSLSSTLPLLSLFLPLFGPLPPPLPLPIPLPLHLPILLYPLLNFPSPLVFPLFSTPHLPLPLLLHLIPYSTHSHFCSIIFPIVSLSFSAHNTSIVHKRLRSLSRYCLPLFVVVNYQ